MKTVSASWSSNITAPSREICARIKVYSGATLLYTLLPTDYIKDIKITKDVNGKFFGYTVCQQAVITLIDKDSALSIGDGHRLDIELGCSSEYLPYTSFYVDTAVRDNVAKTITITAYDVMNDTEKHTVSELNITYPITFTTLLESSVGQLIGRTIEWDENPTELTYTTSNKINVEGTETIRELLNWSAEITNTICAIDGNNNIHFYKLDNSTTDLTITKSDYFTLSYEQPINITKISSVTELGDTVSYGSNTGYEQILRDNPFLALRDDVSTILSDIYSYKTLTPYTLKWRGNPALEIGDYIRIQLEDNSYISMWYLGEAITYDGGLCVESEWKLNTEENSAGNATTIGEAIKQTFAKVDKTNKRIDLVVSDTTQGITALQMDVNSLQASVTSISESTDNSIQELSDNITTLTNTVNTKMSSADVQLQINQTLANGVTSVETTTGFTFNQEGLTISKSNSEISTQITEDGMQVKKDNETVLTANNQGVDAVNLHATTYLIIGDNCRFEDYGNYTACYFIG